MSDAVGREIYETKIDSAWDAHSGLQCGSDAHGFESPLTVLECWGSSEGPAQMCSGLGWYTVGLRTGDPATHLELSHESISWLWRGAIKSKF